MRRAALLALLAAGCGAPPPGACVCATTEFCCLGACLPLGSTCPPTDGGPPLDAPAPPDCEPRPVPGGGAASSSARCRDGGVWWCTGAPTPCNEGYECAEWLDPSGTIYRAGCIEAGRAVCDPSLGDACDGGDLLLCAALEPDED